MMGEKAIGEIRGKGWKFVATVYIVGLAAGYVWYRSYDEFAAWVFRNWPGMH